MNEKRRTALRLWGGIAAVVAVLAAVAVVVFVSTSGSEGDDEARGGSPKPEVPAPGWEDCDRGHSHVIVYFETDEEMTAADRTLRADQQIAATAPSTKAENFERFKELFADQPELVKIARVEAIPASVAVLPAQDVDLDGLADRLRAKYPGEDTVEPRSCAAPPR